ncbi:hypothetical protein DM01DRAFT_1332288 [Hesseltinella vesiculosa]|uniref:SUN domain-containing protein n=1 Tax=Hesseltinella vesiculosa TaxID=101127 RepID=A0A1X2GVV8_9FUNG|nr:hypothetical protein DM01DRAFT_1332288 [Hesseltinella vesiculosa]
MCPGERRMPDPDAVLFQQDVLAELDTLYPHQMRTAIDHASPAPPADPLTQGPLPASPLPSSNGNTRVPFPSFEEWKIKQQEKAGDHGEQQMRKPKRKPSPGSHLGRQTIDSVDGDFSDDRRPNNTYDEDEYIAPQPSKGKNDNRLARVPLKPLKERFNYAWTICAATVRDVNKEARGAQSILYESKDQYLLNRCSADKFVVIHLCDEILIDTIVLANYEFFSSTFKDFRVYVANTYPTTDWKLLGQWQAHNARDLQIFHVQNRIGWFEYMKIEFLTHYGNEYYCPLSLVRVHGMTEMEYWYAVESHEGAADGEIESEQAKGLWPADVREEIIQPQMVTNTSEWFPIAMPEDDPDQDRYIESDEDDNNGALENLDQPVPSRPQDVVLPNDPPLSDTIHQPPSPPPDAIDHAVDPDHATKGADTATPQATLVDAADPLDAETPSLLIASTSIARHDQVESALPSSAGDQVSQLGQVGDGWAGDTDPTPGTGLPLADATPSTIDIPSPDATGPEASASVFPQASSTDTPNLTEHAPAEPGDWPEQVGPPSIGSSHFLDNSTLMDAPNGMVHQQPPTNNTQQPSAKPDSAEDGRPVKPAEDQSRPNKPKESTQESIYKIIMKRLSALEQNATLSTQYLDAQNHMLNDMFTEIEKRHQEQLMVVLERLNETASSRIDSIKRRYELSYEDLKTQMDSNLQEMAAKISILTDQISFERRLAVTQWIIVIMLVVGMALSRGTLTTLSPVMLAQAMERKRRELASKKKDLDSAAAAVAAAEPRIKLDMDGKKAAALEALRLHLVHRANLSPSPKLKPSLTSSDTTASTSSRPTSTPILDPPQKANRQRRRSSPASHDPQLTSSTTSSHTTTTSAQPRRPYRRSISLQDATNTHDDVDPATKRPNLSLDTNDS